MKVRFQVRKDGSTLLENIYDVADAESFAKACADIWQRLEVKEFATATSVGALMDRLEQNALELFDGAVIAVSGV